MCFGLSTLSGLDLHAMELYALDAVSAAGSPVHKRSRQRIARMSLGTILIILLILILLGVIPSWGYSNSWGYGPSGIVGTILVIVVILALLGRI